MRKRVEESGGIPRAFPQVRYSICRRVGAALEKVGSGVGGDSAFGAGVGGGAADAVLVGEETRAVA